MQNRNSVRRSIALVCALAFSHWGSLAAPAQNPGSSSQRAFSRALAFFTPNRGQWPDAWRFVARDAKRAVTIEDAGFSVTEAGCSSAISFQFVLGSAGANGAQARGDRPLETRVHFFVGSDPSSWRTDLPAYQEVHIGDAANGVGVAFGFRAGEFEYDVEFAPGVQCSAFEARCPGAALELDALGRLLVHRDGTTLAFSIPATFTVDRAGQRQPSEARFVLLGTDRFGFVAEDRDVERALIVDPALVYSTFLGSSSFDQVNSITVDGSCAGIVAGWTLSPAFPTTGSAFDTTFNGTRDAFVAKLSDGGHTLVYASFLGGGDDDEATCVAADAQGSVLVAGRTRSASFPTTVGAYDTSANGAEDVFVARLDPFGSTLEFSTRIGGEGEDVPTGVVFVSDGDAIVAGTTRSLTFPTVAGSFDVFPHGGRDGFVARLAAAGDVLVYSSRLGGSQDDDVLGLAVPGYGSFVDRPCVTGATTSSDFPASVSAFATSLDGASDGFVTAFDPSGASLAFSTFLGGVNADVGAAIAVADDGSVTLAGETWSNDFPVTPGAYSVAHSGGIADGFVATLTATGSALTASTFLGGSGLDHARAVALDALTEVRVAGATSSSDFPITAGAPQATYAGGTSDGFIARLDPTLTTLETSTYLGGFDADTVASLAVDCTGRTLAAGGTYSGNSPVTVGSFDPTFNGQLDGFVLALPKESTTCATPASTANYGAGKPGSLGVPGLAALVLPKVPTKPFGIRISNGLPGALPVLFLGPAPLNLAFDGGALRAFPTFILFLLPFDAAGNSDAFGPICDVPVYCGVSVYMQAMFVDPLATGYYHTAQTPGLTLTLGF